MYQLQKMTLPLVRDTTYEGRNGVGVCKEAEVLTFPSPTRSKGWDISIRPVNSKGYNGRCSIIIPGEQSSAFTSCFPGNLGEVILNNLPRSTLAILLGIDPILDAEIEKRLKEK